jgi:hypothetical protein
VVFMRPRHIMLPAAFVAMLPFACGGQGTNGTTGTGTTSGMTSTGTGGTGGGTAGAGGLGGGCASALLCGTPAVCCPEGDDCVEGVCITSCPGAVHCNGGCCSAGQICLSSACVTPTEPCTDSVDCTAKEFCEPTLGQCLPEPPGGPTCQFHPPVGPFAPALKWSWTGSSIKPDHDQIVSVPLVADLDMEGGDDLQRWLRGEFSQQQEWREIPTSVDLCPGVSVILPR